MTGTATDSGMDVAGRIAVVVASHSEKTLAANLGRSPLLARVPLHVERDAPSAAIAYNRALDATTAGIVVFAHHDVFLPLGWDRLLMRRVAEVQAIDPDWAVLAAYGIGLDADSCGPVWSSSLGMIVGRVPLQPAPVQSCDEMLIVLRRSSGLRFDEALPGWHMYGTDIVQMARKAGKGAWAAPLPCIHNDRSHGVLGPDFDEACAFMERKWAGSLPIQTPVTTIGRSALSRLRHRWHRRKHLPLIESLSIGTDHAPEDLAALCGWSDLTASAS